MALTEARVLQDGQTKLWEHTFSFAVSMALKCAVDLRVADIMNSHGVPISLSQIAAKIDSHSPNIPNLERIMRLLVRIEIFSAHQRPNSEETLYGLTASSRWFLHDTELSLAPFISLQNSEWLMAPWYRLAQFVKESVPGGSTGFSKCYGSEIFDFASKNHEFNNLFNAGMESTATVMVDAILRGYKDGFSSIGSLVDVGGGNGHMISKIVKAHPHIKGINFDLPHVIAAAPKHEGVANVGGNIFEAIPKADAIFMQRVLASFNDEDSIKVLKNCLKAIPKETGKVVIIDPLLDLENEGPFDEMIAALDLSMMMLCKGGQERTKLEWQKILEASGFLLNRVIKIPAALTIVEAYPA